MLQILILRAPEKANLPGTLGRHCRDLVRTFCAGCFLKSTVPAFSCCSALKNRSPHVHCISIRTIGLQKLLENVGLLSQTVHCRSHSRSVWIALLHCNRRWPTTEENKTHTQKIGAKFREQKRHLSKNHTIFLKTPWTAGGPWKTPGRCPGKNFSFSIEKQNRKSLGHQLVDPCLSRQVSQGHPAGVPRIFLKFMCPSRGLKSGDKWEICRKMQIQEKRK